MLKGLDITEVPSLSLTIPMNSVRINDANLRILTEDVPRQMLAMHSARDGSRIQLSETQPVIVIGKMNAKGHINENVQVHVPLAPDTLKWGNRTHVPITSPAIRSEIAGVFDRAGVAGWKRKKDDYPPYELLYSAIASKEVVNLGDLKGSFVAGHWHTRTKPFADTIDWLAHAGYDRPRSFHEWAKWTAGNTTRHLANEFAIANAAITTITSKVLDPIIAGEDAIHQRSFIRTSNEPLQKLDEAAFTRTSTDFNSAFYVAGTLRPGQSFLERREMDQLAILPASQPAAHLAA